MALEELTPEEEKIEQRLYGTADEADTIRGMIEALTIFAKYADDSDLESFFTSAEHDVIYFHIPLQILKRTSEDGKRLVALGFSADTDTEQWQYFT